MLLILVFLIFLTSLLLCCIKRDRRSVLILLTCTSLLVYFTGILIYIAKKGGIGSDTVRLLYGFPQVRVFLQYRRFTLSELGFYLAVGRYTLPFFLLWTALDMCYFPMAVRMKRHIFLFSVLPIISLIAYIPAFFRSFIVSSETLLRSVVICTRCWIIIYLVMTIFIMLYEYFMITSHFFRRRFISKSLLLISIAILYGIYSPQDPAQVYLFYNNDYMWMLGLWYLSPGFSTSLYYLVLSLTLVCSFISILSIFRYLSLQWDEEREEASIEKKGKYAMEGVSVFIHGIKNELLSSRILISRLEKGVDTEENLRKLKAVNEKLLSRTEKLYASVRPDSMHLAAVPLLPLLEKAVEKAHVSYPDSSFSLGEVPEGVHILADGDYFTEAISNLLVNGWEASHRCVDVRITFERLWTVINIIDKGCGISKESGKHIFEPFYSSKNSSSNWGMGMYFTRRIIKAHMGYIRFESVEGDGTKFMVMLPKFGRIEEGRR